MKRVRFIAAARQEFLAEVAYYNDAEPGLRARFTAAIEKATARAAAFSQPGSPSAANTRRVFTRGFPFSIIYGPNKTVSWSSQWPIMRGNQAIGDRE